MAPDASKPLYMGFDLSTQQLKAIVINSKLDVISEAKVDFDADFGSKYGITKGVRTNEAEGEVYGPVRMYLEAIELVLERLRKVGCPMENIMGTSGAGMQHGSVFWNDQAEAALKNLDGSSKTPLVDQLSSAFSYDFSPNWQDHSTQAECDLFDAHLGSPEKLAEITGSSAHHRFTGPQILRMRRRRPEVYAKTARISLVSSFLASVLTGTMAPLDVSDVTGMNLWDMRGEKWCEPLLELTGGGTSEGAATVRRQLGDVWMDGGASVGTISPFFTSRFGISSDCQVLPFTGDNPATILSLPLRPMDAMVSLGTSTTFLMSTMKWKPDPSYHFMNHPTTTNHFMFMLCYKNGGLAREKVRDALPKSSSSPSDPWETFNKTVLSTPPLGLNDNDENKKAKLGLYFYLPEIVPNIRAGTWRYKTPFPPAPSTLTEEPQGAPSETWGGAEADARAIVESQALSLRLRSKDLVETPPGTSLPAQPRRIYLVGGGSLNPAIARVMGDVLGGSEGVYKLDVGGNACALGGAYKAVWGLERGEEKRTFDDLIGERWDEAAATKKVDVGYRGEEFGKYGEVLGAFENIEKEVLAKARN